MDQNPDQRLLKLLDAIWADYCQLNPQAKKIYDLFVNEGETVLNDHIAFRTLQHPKLGIAGLAKHFEKFGYTEKGEYFFKEKKLYATHYEHSDSTLPKIFISELELGKMSTATSKILHGLIDGLDANFTDQESHMYSGRPWNLTHSAYLELAEESEYASWVAAFGFRTNHFTVFVNALKKYSNLPTLNEFVKGHGYRLNTSGGEIKGHPSEFLEQSSTMAEKADIKFSDGVFQVPSCYYEFAKRYPMENGKLFTGFVAQSADKIFESTNRN